MFDWFGHGFNTYILHCTQPKQAAFWGGLGSDLTYLIIAVTAVATVYKRIKCHNCWRPGIRHPAHGFHTCKKHYYLLPEGVYKRENRKL